MLLEAVHGRAPTLGRGGAPARPPHETSTNRSWPSSVATMPELPFRTELNQARPIQPAPRNLSQFGPLQWACISTTRWLKALAKKATTWEWGDIYL